MLFLPIYIIYQFAFALISHLLPVSGPVAFVGLVVFAGDDDSDYNHTTNDHTRDSGGPSLNGQSAAAD